MQKLKNTHSCNHILKVLRFFIARLQGHSGLPEMAEQINQVKTNLQELQENWLQAVEERVASTAYITYLDQVVDGHVMDLTRRVLSKTKNNRADPHFIILFPIAASAGMAPVASVSQNRYVKSILQILHNDPEYAEYSESKELIGNAQKELKENLKHREELYIIESQANTKRRIAMSEACREYNVTYPRLRLLFPDNPKLVESFFIRL